MHDIWIDIKYANILAGRLQQFKVKKNNPYLANFRCPLCGDSEKNKFKTRGYIFQHKTKMEFKCHNCGAAFSFGNFLKRVDVILYEEYSVEAFMKKDVKEEKNIENPKPKFTGTGSPLRGLKKISQLQHDHPAKLYILSRKIENPWHARLFYAPKFAKFVNGLIPGKMNEKKDEPRLIIPFIKEDGTVFGFQGRSFDPKTTLRYITIMLEDYPKIFGLDKVNKSERCYVLEGPIDSMFLPNSIAMGGADASLGSDFVDPVFIYDNEPRNKDIVRRIDKTIDKGYNVVIWDNTFKGKDINDMVLSGADAEHIKIIIDKRTFKGLEAKVELMNWKKC